MFNDSDADNDDANKLYICKFCQKEFKYKPWYKNHVVIHDTIGKLLCYYCPRYFKRCDNLERYFHTYCGGKSYDCKDCFKSFTFKFNLKYHIDSQNNDNSQGG